jgi:hypothetical protein
MLEQRLEFGVGVRADFAVQLDFFMLRGNPFHRERSLSPGSKAKQAYHKRSGQKSTGKQVSIGGNGMEKFRVSESEKFLESCPYI